MPRTPPALAAMARYARFILCQFVPDPEKPGKTQKYPLHPTGLYKASPFDPAIWMDAEKAYAMAEVLGEGYGVGFAFTDDDPFFFLDIDGCAEGGQWSPLALELCHRFAGALVEVSNSGKGLHIIGAYAGACPDHKCKPTGSGLELYHEGRFVALGHSAQGDAGFDCTGVLTSVIAQYFPPSLATGPGAEWTDHPVEGYGGSPDDVELIRRARASKPSTAAMFGNRATFEDLWTVNEDSLGRAYPAINPADPYDRSTADSALAQHLAYWTGNDCERIDRLMRSSPLCRDKWDYHEAYLPATILRACSLQTSWPMAAKASVVEAAERVHAGAAAVPCGTGGLYVFLHEIPEKFKGWVYVQDRNVAIGPNAEMLRPDAFRIRFGGHKWQIDGEGKLERDAWTAFTQSEGWRPPYAESTCFRPDLPPGQIIESEGHRLLNTWVPIETLKIEGDPAPFLDLFHKLLPIERDRVILLSYMAAIIQHPGKKFQWWPVIQGTKGNGKSTLARCVAHAVGHRYSFFPNVDKLARDGMNFNGWTEGNLFLGLEEVYVPHRSDFLESFKSTVTNERGSVERKGVDAKTGDNYANGMMFTNHKNGVPQSRDERRYATFFTAQQSKDDRLRDGMSDGYFPRLYAWFRGEGEWAAFGADYGYAVVAHYLAHYPIPAEFNPAFLCVDAPTTSSSAGALVESRGALEQEVIESVEQGVPGFCGGWVSSIALDKLIERLHLGGKVPRAKRREVLESLGYIAHPGLPDGRCNNVVMPDAGKPRLFVRAGHLSLNVTNPSDLLRMYSQAQGCALSSCASA